VCLNTYIFCQSQQPTAAEEEEGRGGGGPSEEKDEGGYLSSLLSLENRSNVFLGAPRGLFVDGSSLPALPVHFFFGKG